MKTTIKTQLTTSNKQYKILEFMECLSVFSRAHYKLQKEKRGAIKETMVPQSTVNININVFSS